MINNYYENKEGELFVDPIVANHNDLTKLSNAEGERRHVKAITNTPNPIDVIYSDIIKLEQTITPRRLREALLSGDTTFISETEDKISELRKKLGA